MSHAAHAEESLRGPERNCVSRRGAGTLGQNKESTAVSLSAPPRLCASRYRCGLRPGRLGGEDSRQTKPIWRAGTLALRGIAPNEANWREEVAGPSNWSFPPFFRFFRFFRLSPIQTSRRNALRRHYEHGWAGPNKANSASGDARPTRNRAKRSQLARRGRGAEQLVFPPFFGFFRFFRLSPIQTSRRNALRRHYEHGCAAPNKAKSR